VTAKPVKQFMSQFFKQYKQLEKPILCIIMAELCVQFINASFLLILNIFMAKQGYKDYLIADFVSYRFLGVIALAFPLGLIIKGRRLKPLFYAAGLGLPTASLFIIHAVAHHYDVMLYISLTCWGLFFTCAQVCIIPYILRNSSVETQSEAISLNYAMWSVSTIITGTAIYVFAKLNPIMFNEKLMLQIFSVMGYACVIFIYLIKTKEQVPTITGKRRDLSNFDWVLIIKSLLPTLIIAVGAGLTIPFINLFFFSVHHIDSDGFSIISSLSAVLVTAGALLVPYVKRNFGYGVAITLFQAFAIIALILLASTDFYASWQHAWLLATIFFLLRQPLMNMAAPMTTELVMAYAGKRNQEMVSALTSAIWSGSWFISARIFKLLRETGLSYGYVFLTTAGIYAVGVLWYHFLIQDYHRRMALTKA
jgi:hypothetical protein